MFRCSIIWRRISKFPEIFDVFGPTGVLHAYIDALPLQETVHELNMQGHLAWHTRCLIGTSASRPRGDRMVYVAYALPFSRGSDKTIVDNVSKPDDPDRCGREHVGNGTSDDGRTVGVRARLDRWAISGWLRPLQALVKVNGGMNVILVAEVSSG